MLHRFADVPGIDITGWQGKDAQVNDSLDRVQSELVRRLNQVTAGAPSRMTAAAWL